MGKRIICVQKFINILLIWYGCLNSYIKVIDIVLIDSNLVLARYGLNRLTFQKTGIKSFKHFSINSMSGKYVK